MLRTRSPRGFTLIALYLCVAIVPLTGCEKPQPIVTYEIPTEVPTQLRPGKQRMLAAMIPVDDNVWFFKVSGPEPAIASIEEKFREFVQTITFVDGEPDLSELPATWKRAGEKPMRYASINIETPQKQLDLSISSLPRMDDWDEQVVMNINRWRGQLGLNPSNESQAGGQPIEVQAIEDSSIWVDLTGKPSSDPSGMTPRVASRSDPTLSSNSDDNLVASNDRKSPESRLKYERPEGWRDGKMSSSMRLAAFNVGPTDSQAEVTIIPAGGDVRGNVARWLGQIRNNNVADETVDAAMDDAEKIKVSGRDARRFILTGDGEGDSIDATIVPLEDGFSLFVKMTGPSKTVKNQYDAMTSFLNSLEI